MEIIFELNKDIINSFLYDKVMTPIYVFQESVESLIFWLPIIWKDRDWDYNFLLKLIEIKIKKMKKFFEEEGVAIHSKRELREMIIASSILERLRKEKYADYQEDKHEEKWGKLELINGQFKRKDLSEEEAKKEREEFKRIIDHEDYMIKQDLDYFCKMFKKVRKWWD